ncbi:MAG: hypothetical protein JWO80_2521 [Bryobacterales bacterium]|nr:hypothetical protein [Bryobacterales bacterium]
MSSSTECIPGLAWVVASRLLFRRPEMMTFVAELVHLRGAFKCDPVWRSALLSAATMFNRNYDLPLRMSFFTITESFSRVA